MSHSDGMKLLLLVSLIVPSSLWAQQTSRGIHYMPKALVEQVESDTSDPSVHSDVAGVPHSLPISPVTVSSTTPSGILPPLSSATASSPGSSIPTPPPRLETISYPTIDVTGFFQLDFAWFDQDLANRATVGDIGDLVDFRRARLAARGQAAENVGYMIEFDFAFPGRPSFMDLWIELQDLPIGNLKIGQFRQPFSMEAMTSVRDMTFLERGLPFVFLPFRQTGAIVSGTALEDSVTYAVSGYRYPADPDGGVFGDGGYGLSARVSAALIYDPEENLVLHAGGAYSYNRPSTGVLQFRQTPEIGFNFGVAGPVPFFVDTGVVPSDSVSLAGAELAFASGGLLIQSEFIAAQLNPTTGGNGVLTGGYAQASYVLTGEQRRYNPKQGTFGRVKPQNDLGAHGYGAWELAARYSFLDFNDGPIQGGRLSDVTLGTNWYLNSYTKLQFNYIHAFLDRAPHGDSNADIYALRVQLDF